MTRTRIYLLHLFSLGGSQKDRFGLSLEVIILLIDPVELIGIQVKVVFIHQLALILITQNESDPGVLATLPSFGASFGL